MMRIIKSIKYKYWRLKNRNKFLRLGKYSFINIPLKIDGAQNIEINDFVTIGAYSWIAALPLTGHECKLIFGKGSVIGNFNHIYATKRITLGEKVLTADKVYISDNLHGYDRIDIAIMDQPVKQVAEVVIGDGSWLGENVCIIGASVGKNCIIGANSVVTRDIPDYSIAVGAPAKIIKRYCLKENIWKKSTPEGVII